MRKKQMWGWLAGAGMCILAAGVSAAAMDAAQSGREVSQAEESEAAAELDAAEEIYESAELNAAEEIYESAELNAAEEIYESEELNAVEEIYESEELIAAEVSEGAAEKAAQASGNDGTVSDDTLSEAEETEADIVISGEDFGQEELLAEDGNGFLLEVKEVDEEDPAGLPPCGVCGEALTWEITEEGVLRIEGEGPMADYSLEDAAPWRQYVSEVNMIEVGEGASSIGEYAFDQMERAERILISSTVREIGDGAFRACGLLEAIEVDAANPYYQVCDGVLYTKDGSVLVCYPKRLGASSYEALPSTKAISKYAFYGQTYLKTLLLPDGIMEIGDNAFAECKLTMELIPADGTQD